MIKMLVADDERVIRKGIISSIDWTSYGIEIVGEASNGQEAAQLCFSKQPDIVLLDIRMPILDGLEAAKIIKQSLPNIKIVFLTGYDDVEYLKTALKVRASDYLLKPVSADELIKVVVGLKESIIEEQKKSFETLLYKNIVEENIYVLRSSFLKSLFANPEIVLDPVKERLLKIPLEGPYFQVILVVVEDIFMLMESSVNKNKEFVLNLLSNLIEEDIQEKYRGFVFYGNFGDNTLILIVNLSEPKEIDEKLLNQIKSNAKKYLNVKISFSKGIVVSSKKELHLSLKSATDSKFLPSQLTEDEVELLNAFMTLDKEKTTLLVNKFFEKLEDQGDKNSLENSYKKLSDLILTKAKEICPVLKNEFVKSAAFFLNMQESKNMKKSLTDFVLFCIDKIQNVKESRHKKIIKDAITYIEKNYANQILLSDIAEVCGISPNYFCKIFKEETGKSFVDFLNELRVNKAKELLLSTNLKSYEVAEKVGFSDYKYFSMIFKKYTGFSPRKFKEEEQK